MSEYNADNSRFIIQSILKSLVFHIWRTIEYFSTSGPKKYRILPGSVFGDGLISVKFGTRGNSFVRLTLGQDRTKGSNTKYTFLMYEIIPYTNAFGRTSSRIYLKCIAGDQGKESKEKADKFTISGSFIEVMAYNVTQINDWGLREITTR